MAQRCKDCKNAKKVFPGWVCELGDPDAIFDLEDPEYTTETDCDRIEEKNT